MTDPSAADLDVAVELINTVYALADPADSLTDVAVFRDVLDGLGHGDLARDLRAQDLEPLRLLRARLRQVFAAATSEEAVRLVNAMLVEAAAVPQLELAADGTAILRLDGGRRGLAALAARLPAALAVHIAEHGIERLGTCQAAPCGCAFVDRTRARTRRYCCDTCNDRAAAAAYRRRRR